MRGVIEDAEVERVPVIRRDVSSNGLEGDLAAYRSAGCAWLARTDAGAILYLVRVPRTETDPEVIVPFALTPSLCEVTA